MHWEEDISPVFSAIASRRDLLDKERAERERFKDNPRELKQAEERIFEDHSKLANMEKVVAGLQTVIAYFEEARLRRDQEMARNRQIFKIKERLRAEEEHVRVLVSHIPSYARILITGLLL